MDQATGRGHGQETAWEVIKGTLLTIVLVFYYWLVAIVKSVLPASVQGKDVSGETVLVTGAGLFGFCFFYNP